MENKPKLTDFGFEKVPEEQKELQVKKVFDDVAPKYDLMNDILSFGLHRLWKEKAVEEAAIKPGMNVLDIAGGTADMSLRMAPFLKGEGQLWLTDINENMLAIGKQRMDESGYKANIAVCDAENLPFEDNYFDVVMVSFGLRNMTHKDVALKEMYRVCKKGGKVLVLEFSKTKPWFTPFYDLYSFKVMPLLASRITGHAENYRYLAESIRMHPNQETLAKIMRDVGFDSVTWKNFFYGITALHIGKKTK